MEKTKIIELGTTLGDSAIREQYDVYDGCYGTVIDTCRSGSFIRLDNNENAFAYAGLQPGTEVLCTVRRKPRDEWDRTLVSIDSVLSRMPLAV